MSVIPVLETERLILKAPTVEDAPAYYKYFADYEVIKTMGDGIPYPVPEGSLENFLKNNIIPRQGNKFWFWGIFLKEKPDEMIGSIEIWDNEDPHNQGFWIGKKFWGKGLMTEAVSAVNTYAFNELAFEKIVNYNAKGNIGSSRINKKLGAKLTGTAPSKYLDPAYTEDEIWELTKENWIKFKVV